MKGNQENPEVFALIKLVVSFVVHSYSVWCKCWWKPPWANFVRSAWLLVWMKHKLELLVWIWIIIVSLDGAQLGIVSLDLDGLRSNEQRYIFQICPRNAM